MYWIATIGVFFSVLVLGIATLEIAFTKQARLGRRYQGRVRHLGRDVQREGDHQHPFFKDASMSSLPALDKVLRRGRLGKKLELWLHQAGKPIKAGPLVLISLTATALGFLLGRLYGHTGVMVGLMAVGIYGPGYWVHRLRRHRMARLESQFPETVDLITRAIKAGHSFTTAWKTAADEMEAPISDELMQTFEEYTMGKRIEDALDGFRSRITLSEVNFFVTAVKLQREVGGNLTEVLEQISDIIRQRFKLLRHVKSLSSEGRMSARILCVLPFAVFLMIYLNSKGYAMTLLVHPVGKVLLYVGLGLMLLGVFTIKRIVKLKV